MREWLNDPRAYYVFRHWRKTHHERGEYGEIGDFRAWVALTTKHFFNVNNIWPDRYVAICCVALGVPAQLPYLLSDETEDLRRLFA